MYDLFILTYIPSFYKINLYNEIAKKKNLFVVFISSGSNIRNNDFFNRQYNFDFTILQTCDIEKRNKSLCCLKLFFILKKKKHKKLFIGSWDLPEFWLAAFFSPKKKNIVTVESSIYESKTHAPYALIKKVFLTRMSTAYVSGTPQALLLDKLGFKGSIITTGGVGLFNKKHYLRVKNKIFNNKFLFIGRLSNEKNIILLIDVFKLFIDKSLTIVGNGPLKSQVLEHINNVPNIKYFDSINNNEISKLYLEHDIFILPSSKEPWGLVIEEALYFGLPCIVSNKVGCSDDYIKKYGTGLITEPSIEGLQEAITRISVPSIYQEKLNNIQKINFVNIFNYQVNVYLL